MFPLGRNASAIPDSTIIPVRSTTASYTICRTISAFYTTIKIGEPWRLIAWVMSNTYSTCIGQRRRSKMVPAISLAGGHLTSLLSAMLAKITAKNQLTLPKQVIETLGNPSYFEVEVDGDRLVLTPSRPGSASAVRRKLQTLGLLDSDVADAVAWARTNK